MNVVGLSIDRLVRQLADLNYEFRLTDLGRTTDCIAPEALRASAAADDATPDDADHVHECSRCSAIFQAFRRIECLRRKNARWSARLDGIRFGTSPELAFECLGRINLATDSFSQCEDDSEWTPHALGMRVNVILDKDSKFFTVTILEVPTEVRHVSFFIEETVYELTGGEVEGTYTLVEELGNLRGADFDEKFDHLVQLLESGRGKFVFQKAAVESLPRTQAGAPTDLLVREGVLEHGYDYVLPCGKHSDTYVNVGSLCYSESALGKVATALHDLFADVSFDTIVTNGWAMATIARRLASLCHRTETRPVREIMCEGYDPPVPTEDIAAGSRVLVLVDVFVTGTLLDRLKSIVQHASANVVAAGCIARASTATDGIRSLCDVAMRLDRPGDCPRCGVCERLEFNPYANCMTVKLAKARSPSQFIAYNDEARQFWELVNQADAYKKHFVERNCHYTAFVDTARLLNHPIIGPTLIENLREKVLSHSTVPTLFLVPRRQRALLLAKYLSEVLEFATPGGRPAVVRVTRRDGAWNLTSSGRSQLYGQRVLVVDSAAGYGRTIDSLTRAAILAGAESAGAAVLLSRMTEACEAAFKARLHGGFFRLFHLPIRPVVIRGTDPSLCPFCRRKAAVRDAAKESGLDVIQWWADRLWRTGFATEESTCTVEHGRKREEQRSLFPIPDSSFLERCRGSVAGGVTLHSLHAAMRNGMAPLALPEIRDETIPAKNRVAMVESLPSGVVEWSRGFLERDLLHFLAAGKTASLWRASVEVLAREGGAEWIPHLRNILQHAGPLRHRAMPTFWNSLACDTYLAVHRNPGIQGPVQDCLEMLAEEYGDTAAADGLRQVLAATSK